MSRPKARVVADIYLRWPSLMPNGTDEVNHFQIEGFDLHVGGEEGFITITEYTSDPTRGGSLGVLGKHIFSQSSVLQIYISRKEKEEDGDLQRDEGE